MVRILFECSFAVVVNRVILRFFTLELCVVLISDDGGGDESKGREYDYVEDWGEQLVGKSQTVIVRLALDTGKVDVIARKSFGVEKDNPNVHKVKKHNHSTPYRLATLANNPV